MLFEILVPAWQKGSVNGIWHITSIFNITLFIVQTARVTVYHLFICLFRLCALSFMCDAIIMKRLRLMQL